MFKALSWKLHSAQGHDQILPIRVTPEASGVRNDADVT